VDRERRRVFTSYPTWSPAPLGVASGCSAHVRLYLPVRGRSRLGSSTGRALIKRGVGKRLPTPLQGKKLAHPSPSLLCVTVAGCAAGSLSPLTPILAGRRSMPLHHHG
jgi:hypothetical protein